MDYGFHGIINTSKEHGLEVRIKNTVVKHTFYFDQNSDIKIINIPRCASTSLKLALGKQRREVQSPFKCVLFRNPTDRLKSTMFYTMYSNRSFKGSWKTEPEFSSMAELFLKIMKKEDTGNWNNGYLFLHFIPQVFFYENSFRLDRRKPDLLGLMDNEHDMRQVADAFNIKDVACTHSSKYTAEFEKFFRRWYKIHATFFKDYYAQDWEIYNRLNAERSGR